MGRRLAREGTLVTQGSRLCRPDTLADAEEILVVGPADAEVELVKFLQERHKDVARRIVGVEPSDHPSDDQMVAQLRKYFLAADRMRA